VISLDEMRLMLDENLSPGLLVYDLMVRDCPTISPDNAEKRQLLGMLSRRRLTRAYVERMSHLQRERPS
jgi:hypothetical protein